MMFAIWEGEEKDFDLEVYRFVFLECSKLVEFYLLLNYKRFIGKGLNIMEGCRK